MRVSATRPVLVAGGGIGGLAAALALSRLGMSDVRVLEQSGRRSAKSAPASSLRPNAFAALDALGVGESARRAGGPSPSGMVMMDAVDGSEVGEPFPSASAFRRNASDNPYAVIHRADIHRIHCSRA